MLMESEEFASACMFIGGAVGAMYIYKMYIMIVVTTSYIPSSKVVISSASECGPGETVTAAT